MRIYIYTLIACYSFLAEILKSFYSLDIDGNGSLDYYEFSSFTGDTKSARFAFEKMDGNSDRVLTQQELTRAVEMLERQTTEGTEALPDSDTDVDSTKPVGSPLSTDTAETQPVIPTGTPADAGPSPYGEQSGRTDVTPDSETGDSETGPESDHSENTISNNLQRTIDQLEGTLFLLLVTCVTFYSQLCTLCIHACTCMYMCCVALPCLFV